MIIIMIMIMIMIMIIIIIIIIIIIKKDGCMVSTMVDIRGAFFSPSASVPVIHS